MEQKVTVPLDCGYEFFWVAEYSDGSFYPQFDSAGSERLFGSVDHSRLVRFHFVNVVSERRFSVNVGLGCRLIALRRHHHALNRLDSKVDDDVIEYVLGFQKTVCGVNVKCLMVIDSSCNVVLMEEV